MVQNMRRIFFTTTLFIILAQLTTAQRTVYYEESQKLFNQGKEMFSEGNYTGAQDFLSRYVAQSNNRLLLEEARYMIAVSAFERGSENSGSALRNFLDEHPESSHRNRVYFLVASYHFDRKEWQLAKAAFDASDLDYLTPSEQEDYSFRAAYTNLQLGNKNEARRYFGLLYRNSNKYRDAADYYSGYIDYSDGEYDAALRRFERLRNHSEYREEALFYSVQATFFKEDLEGAVRLAEDFVQTFPQSTHNEEIYRILGNGNYRLGRTARAIPYYEKYLTYTQNPLRGDAYFLGLSYSETGKYDDALRMFQKATGKQDALNQNAQLHLGQTYLKLGQKQAAQMAFEAASRDNFEPKVRETAMFNYALLAHETNFSVFSESITLFENFLREYPGSQYTNQVNDILAETFLTAKDYKAALAAINRISNPGRRILEAKQMVLFQLGAQEFVNGDMNAAIRYFNNTLSLGDYDAKAKNNAYYWRGEAYYRTGNYTNAGNDFAQFTQNASSSYDNYASGWYNLGYSYFKQQQYVPAVNAFQRYVSAETDKNKPELADAYNRIGDSYYYNRNFAEAEKLYAQAAAANPSAADYAAYQKAFVMGLQHNYQGKITALDNLMQHYPNSQYFDDALYEKSRALTMLGRENDAIGVLQKLVSDYPQSRLASQAGIQLGQLYYNTGNYTASIDAYKNVIKNFAGSDDAKSALVSLETVYRETNDIQSYVNYANSLPGGIRITPSRQDSLTYLAAEGLYMKGSKNEAEAAMLRYLQSYPHGAYAGDANYYLGIIVDEKGNTPQALSHFRKVIDANNTKFLDNALSYAANAEYESGDYRAALADYSKLAHTANSAANRQKGLMGVIRAQSRLENDSEASRAATELLRNPNLSPEIKTEALYLRAKAYHKINEEEKAIADFQSIANDTRNIYGAEAQFILADTYFRRKSYDKAENQVKEFMKQGTPHQYWMARALIILSDTYRAKGDNFQAQQYLESLKNNYKGSESDIQQMINERLN